MKNIFIPILILFIFSCTKHSEQEDDYRDSILVSIGDHIAQYKIYYYNTEK